MKRKGRLTKKFLQEFVGKTFIAKGLVDTRVIKIKRVYYLDMVNFGHKYVSFECEIIKSKLNERIGERTNFLCSDIIRNGELIEKINVLAR